MSKVISFSSKGDFSNIEKFLAAMQRRKYLDALLGHTKSSRGPDLQKLLGKIQILMKALTLQ